MEEPQEASMSINEFRQFVVQHPEITQSKITFATPISEREKEEIIENFAVGVSVIQNTMSELTANKNNCIRDALKFAYSRDRPKLEYYRKIGVLK